jgi:hypothetical protein
LAALAVPLLADVNLAIRYLEDEVPRWERENGCHSCHNNGDGARALMLLKARGYAVSDEALRDTLGWLRQPSKWEPKALARVQFSGGLVAAMRVALISDRQPLLEAAALLAADQSADGSWRIDEAAVGAPATYGPYLATYVALEVLETADKERFAEPIAKSTRWLRSQKPQSALDAAAHFLATREPTSLDVLLRSQTAEGAWLNEPFDTAMALLALAAAPRAPAVTDAIARGRAWLQLRQLPEGGWPGTTRPAGGASYAQHISTTAWAAIALTSTAP